ncbi:MAG: hypothetical protein LQ340_008040, partial [Diploschistes diacapsis]
IYRTADGPYYYTGNKILLGVTAWNIALIVGAKCYYSWRNRVRERKWQAMSSAEREGYLSGFARGGGDRGDKGVVGGGNKRLDFRFTH